MKENANSTSLVQQLRTLVATYHHMLCLMGGQGHLHLNSEKDCLKYNSGRYIFYYNITFLNTGQQDC